MSRRKKEPSDNVKPKIKFHQLDLAKIQPLTDNQKALFDAWERFPDRHFFLYGCAGTGKSFLSLYKALYDLLDKDKGYEKILLLRSAVQGRDIGFTPGDVEEKMANYEAPYADICDELFKYSKSYENLKKIGLIDFQSTSFIRGRSFHNTIIILDEAQNCSSEEWNTVFTRVGRNSKLIVCGDIAQNDLTKKKSDMSGFNEFHDIIVNMHNQFDMIEFGIDDIVRSGFVRDYIITRNRLSK